MNLDKWIGPLGYPLPPTADQVSWKEYSAEDGSYKILMPGTAEVIVQDVPNPLGGKLKMKGLQMERREWPAMFMSFAFEMDLEPELVDQALGLACEGELEKSNGKLLSTKRITHRGHAGRELIFEKAGLRKETNYHIGRCIIAEGYQVYAAVLVNRKENISADFVSKYLDSLEIKAKKK
jgi:hypothetical protein